MVLPLGTALLGLFALSRAWCAPVAHWIVGNPPGEGIPPVTLVVPLPVVVKDTLGLLRDFSGLPRELAYQVTFGNHQVLDFLRDLEDALMDAQKAASQLGLPRDILGFDTSLALAQTLRRTSGPLHRAFREDPELAALGRQLLQEPDRVPWRPRDVVGALGPAVQGIPRLPPPGAHPRFARAMAAAAMRARAKTHPEASLAPGHLLLPLEEFAQIYPGALSLSLPEGSKDALLVALGEAVWALPLAQGPGWLAAGHFPRNLLGKLMMFGTEDVSLPLPVPVCSVAVNKPWPLGPRVRFSLVPGTPLGLVGRESLRADLNCWWYPEGGPLDAQRFFDHFSNADLAFVKAGPSGELILTGTMSPDPQFSQPWPWEKSPSL